MHSTIRHVLYVTQALDGWLPASPATVWPFVSDPDHLNLWSTAPVEGIEPGDGGVFSTVGTMRRVVLPRPLPMVTEVIQHADAPHRFVYRAVGSRAIRYHHGQLLLRAEQSGTRLCWEVGIALPVAGSAALLHRVLLPHLEASLRRLSSVVKDAVEGDLPVAAFQDDEDTDATAAASETATALRLLAEEMLAQGDARHWFSRIYQYVTEEMIEACGRWEVTHPTWALRLIPGFHELYMRSLQGTAEPHWQEAFDAIADATRQTASGALPFWRALVAGARAHIEGDLPRVLASTYRTHYEGRCDFARFRADFMLLAAPIQRAWQRLAAEVPPRWFPPYLRVLDRVLPPEAVEHLTAKRFFDPLTTRQRAFERGQVLATVGASSP